MVSRYQNTFWVHFTMLAPHWIGSDVAKCPKSIFQITNIASLICGIRSEMQKLQDVEVKIIFKLIKEQIYIKAWQLGQRRNCHIQMLAFPNHKQCEFKFQN